MAMLLLVFQTLYFRFFLPLWQKVKSKIGTDNLLRLHAPRFSVEMHLSREDEEDEEDDKGRKYWTQTDFLYHLEQNPEEGLY